MQFEELDSAWRSHLQRVSQAAGRGFPGVYVGNSGCLPWIGLVTGLSILIGTAVLYALLWGEDATNLAMLQTAGVLLGGWMVLAALRVWWGQARASHGRYFIYADPAYIWEVNGSAVWCTKVDDVVDMRYQEVFTNEGNYQSTVLNLALAEGNRAVTVHDQRGGSRLGRYISSLLQRRLDPAWNSASSAATERSARDRDPEDVGEADEARVLEAMLVEPYLERRAPYGWLNLLVIVALGAGLFFGFRQLNRSVREEAIFAHAKNGSPVDLRAYLRDNRHQRHREEAKKVLRQKYDARFALLDARVQQANVVPELAGVHLHLRQVLDTLVEGEPIVSVRVAAKQANAQDAALAPDLRKSFALALEQTLGTEYVACAEAPEQVPAMVDIRYDAPDDPAGQTKWTMTFRKGPEQEPFATKEWTSKNVAGGAVGVRADFRQIVMAMMGHDPGLGGMPGQQLPPPPGFPPEFPPGFKVP